MHIARVTSEGSGSKDIMGAIVFMLTEHGSKI